MTARRLLIESGLSDASGRLGLVAKILHLLGGVELEDDGVVDGDFALGVHAHLELGGLRPFGFLL